MRFFGFIFVFALISATSAPCATTQPAYAPLPAAYSARMADQQPNLPLVTVGCLPAGATSPVNRWTLDAAYFASFRDNQVGKNDRDDPNAREFAMGRLKLLPARPDREIVIAVAIPNLPQTSVTIGTLLVEGNTLALSIDQWQPDQSLDRSKSFNAQCVQMLYLPPLPAGEYRLQLQWHVMTPVQAVQGSGFTFTDYKVAEMPFTIVPAGPNQIGEPANAPSMGSEALHPVPMPKAPGDARTQVPWLMTARWFADIGDDRPGLTVGSGNPFAFLRGDPAQRQLASALPRLDPPAFGKSTHAMIIAPQMMSGEWASADAVHWNGSIATIDCGLWTDSGGRTKNNPHHPVLLVPLIPPDYRAASPEVMPPGHYTVRVIWHNRVAPKQGDWYVEQSQRTEQVEFDVR